MQNKYYDKYLVWLSYCQERHTRNSFIICITSNLYCQFILFKEQENKKQENKISELGGKILNRKSLSKW